MFLILQNEKQQNGYIINFDVGTVGYDLLKRWKQCGHTHILETSNINMISCKYSSAAIRAIKCHLTLVTQYV